MDAHMTEVTTTELTNEECLLAALRMLPGVTCVSTNPVGAGNKPNDHGVRWKLHGKLMREPCTNADGDKPTLDHAIEAALGRLRATLGTQIVDDAVAHCRGETAFSIEETAWLAEWCEQHAAPETITMGMATAALRTRRSTAGGSSASAVLHEAQLLLAQKNGAEQRVRKAQAQLARAERALEQREQSKKARVAMGICLGRSLPGLLLRAIRRARIVKPMIAESREDVDEACNAYKQPTYGAIT